MGEEIEPGLDGFSDSGTEDYDLPVPELPAGIQRTLVRQSSGAILKRPESGDEVEIHYVGTRADGSVFESSRERNEPLRFVLGKGQVIRGLDLAVTTMRLGEVAIFRIAPSFAQGGSLGSCTALPAGALLYEVELLNWLSCSDLFGDGAVVKRVDCRAEDRRRSAVGKQCLLSLRLRLAEDRGASLLDIPALEYTIGGPEPPPSLGGSPLGQKLLDYALLSMRRGEHASLHCAAGTAFAGAAGLPTGLVLESRLVCELRLREFLETLDVSFEKDQTVMKRSLRSRDSWAKCQDAGRCTLRVRSVKDDGNSTLSSDQTLEFTIGNGEVCDALECAVSNMSEGEEAIVSCFRAEMCAEPRLGLSGCPKIVFHLEVAAYEKGPTDEARRDSEKLELYRSRKDMATALFKIGRYRLAAYHFRRIYELLGYIDDYRNVRGGEARKAEVAALKKLCLLNQALSTLKDSNFRGALSACNFVLEEESQNSKALFRRAQAYLGLDDVEQAMCDARAALEVEPKSTDVRRLLADIKARRKVDDVDTRPMYTKMCSVLGKLPHPLDVD